MRSSLIRWPKCLATTELLFDPGANALFELAGLDCRAVRSDDTIKIEVDEHKLCGNTPEKNNCGQLRL
jgi:hypothetical protein